MAKKPTDRERDLNVETFATHQVIVPSNPLRKFIREVDDKDFVDPVSRAEEALAGLSGEFKGWMKEECAQLASAFAIIEEHGYDSKTREDLFRAAHDIKGGAATFGYPKAAETAESLCRIIEHAPDIDKVPDDLIAHHVHAIQAIIREQHGHRGSATAEELSTRLRRIADVFLIEANRDRPEHLEALLAPSIVPSDDPE